jgi:four helix bundle protein
VFHLETLTLEIIKSLKPIVRRIEMRDRNLADQLKRAATSIALNVSEGAHAKGGNRKVHFHTAAGSANESRAALRVASAWGYVEEREMNAVQDKLDHCVAVLWKLTH